MAKSRWILIGAAVVVILAGVWYVKRGGETPAVIDLVKQFPMAETRPAGAGPDIFAIKDEMIGGEKKTAIFAYPPTRITWKFVVPNDAWLRTALGVDEKAWEKEGDGVLFMVGIRVVDGGQYQELMREVIDPHAQRGHRRWVAVTLDLAQYGGRQVELIFNTRTSITGDDRRNDFAYWGAPAICLRP